MSDLLNDTISYLSYLNNECSLNVSVHFGQEILSSLSEKNLEKLSYFNSHDNAYCIKIKGNESSFDNCICFQKEILKKCINEKSFVVKCFAGVIQYIYTIYKQEEIIGFIAVCGYKNNIFFKDDDIPVFLLDSVIPPVAVMLEKLFIETGDVIGDEYNAIVQFLNEYHKNISLSYLCDVFGRSKSHISHLFKKRSGMTINEYCNNLKLEDARKLLLNTNYSITEIAYDSGFNDISYFIRLFKKKFGVTPFNFKKNSG